MNNEKWCPTQHGNTFAYEPQYLDGTEWKRIPIHEITRPLSALVGIPSERYFGGLYAIVSLYGFHQAMALVWGYAAEIAAQEGHHKVPEVMVQEYEFIYDIKARKIEDSQK